MITTPCYCTREDVKSATDFQGTAYNNLQVDRAIQAASRDVEGLLRRKFYPEDTTKYIDWPAQGGQGGGQISYPWRVWLNANDLVSLTSVQSPPGTSLNIAFINLEPANYGPPYTYIELQRDKIIAFSSGTTPQRSIVITGTWGYNLELDSAGTLAAAISSTSATSLNVSDGSQMGVGDLLVVDTERFLVQEKSTLTTGDSQQGSGVSTASAADNVLALTSGSNVNLGEVLLLDAEKMLVLNITGNNVTVSRAYDGSVLATHSAATVYAYRTLTVTRGALGTTAATHSNSAPVSRVRVPALVRELAVAEALNNVLQETSGYARVEGQPGSNARATRASGLDSIRERAYRRYGRKVRYRSV